MNQEQVEKLIINTFGIILYFSTLAVIGIKFGWWLSGLLFVLQWSINCTEYKKKK